MDVGDFIAALALVLSAGSLFLEMRRWFETGPKLHLSVMADGMMIPDDGEGVRLYLTVTNRGDTPTMLTHMIVVAQHPRWQLWQRKRIMQGIVNSSAGDIPSELGVNRHWIGRMNYNDTLRDYRAKGLLYVGVIANHSEKYALKFVPPEPVGIADNPES